MPALRTFLGQFLALSLVLAVLFLLVYVGGPQQ